MTKTIDSVNNLFDTNNMTILPPGTKVRIKTGAFKNKIGLINYFNVSNNCYRVSVGYSNVGYEVNEIESLSFADLEDATDKADNKLS